MRDPQRIDKMLELLRGVWHMYPDMRLGQLVHSLCHLVDESIDSFYTEDSGVERELYKTLKEGL